MESELLKKYKNYINSLMKYMADNGYTKKPFPKVILNNNPQEGDEMHIKTGYYDPESKTITLFTYSRHIKDCIRSCAHELLHHKQNLEGRLGKGSYSGDKIVEDDKLIKLEEEAYKDGNVAFRSWTEMTGS